jgi:hypothetical protein
MSSVVGNAASQVPDAEHGSRVGPVMSVLGQCQTGEVLPRGTAEGVAPHLGKEWRTVTDL